MTYKYTTYKLVPEHENIYGRDEKGRFTEKPNYVGLAIIAFVVYVLVPLASYGATVYELSK